MANLSVNNVVLTIVALAIGIVLIGSLLAPTATDVIADLNAAGNSTWGTLVGVVVVVSILGLVVLAINSYTKDKN